MYNSSNIEYLSAMARRQEDIDFASRQYKSNHYVGNNILINKVISILRKAAREKSAGSPKPVQDGSALAAQQSFLVKKLNHND